MGKKEALMEMIRPYLAASGALSDEAKKEVEKNLAKGSEEDLTDLLDALREEDKLRASIINENASDLEDQLAAIRKENDRLFSRVERLLIKAQLK